MDQLSFAGSRVLLCPLAVDRVLRCVSGSSSVRALEPVGGTGGELGVTDHLRGKNAFLTR